MRRNPAESTSAIEARKHSSEIQGTPSIAAAPKPSSRSVAAVSSNGWQRGPCVKAGMAVSRKPITKACS